MKHKKNKSLNMWLLLLLLLFLLFICIIFFYRQQQKEGFDDKKNYLDGIDIIYWINLNRSVDRKINMQSILKDKVFDGIAQKRIEAYDGKYNPESVFDKLIIDNRKQTDTEYACLLSHLETIRIFNESSHEVALIFEDDVTLEFKKHWKKSVREIIDNAPPDWEIIMLSYIYSNDKSVLFYDWKDSDIEYDKNSAHKYYSSIAYLINKKGASKVMSIFNNNKYYLNSGTAHTADVFTYQLLDTYVYKYPMFIYKTENDSTIHSDHLPLHEISKNNVLKNYNSLTN
jgi:GR25 family glycosyltransferase involved in LPS biosynthesis